jgi:hypothetical protein
MLDLKMMVLDIPILDAMATRGLGCGVTNLQCSWYLIPWQVSKLYHRILTLMNDKRVGLEHNASNRKLLI